MSDAAIPATPALRCPDPEPYPQQIDPPETWWDRAGTAVEAALMPHLPIRRIAGVDGIVRRARRHARRLASLDDAALDREIRDLRFALRRSGLTKRLTGLSFAVIREVSGRTLGLRHFDVQLIGGATLLKGLVAEMATGEGKTLTATLAAGTAALAGIPTHVVTVNDYLTARDERKMRPVYARLGLSTGVIVEGMEPDERRAAYAADVTYCSNKELVFDYLRDRMAMGHRSGPIRLKIDRLQGRGSGGRLVMRGLHFAIVDEADSVLIDEARTPLIISGEVDTPNQDETCETALSIAGSLEEGYDFTVLADERQIELTGRGRGRLQDIGMELGGTWSGTLMREELVGHALTALRLFRRGTHYLVRDGKVQIVDESTGRIMPDRTWTDGLHQMVEKKEGVDLSPRRVSLAQITYQRFFRRYRRLSGMTGTAEESVGELWSVYRLAVVRVPTNRPCRRVEYEAEIWPDAETQWQAIALRAEAVAAEGRAVLIGTRSVSASEAASAALAALDIPHRVLNAAQDEEEASIVAEAGQPGRVTIATNMAGRGTDIELDERVRAAGGLHVIIAERNEAGRIDRQLAGRAARQGDPGSVEATLSMEDPLLEVLPRGARRRSARAFDRAQKQLERSHTRARRNLLERDRHLADMMAFAGRTE